jgi:hypothetical protein
VAILELLLFLMEACFGLKLGIVSSFSQHNLLIKRRSCSQLYRASTGKLQ